MHRRDVDGGGLVVNARDNFSEKIKRILSDRVQGMCSNPNCNVQTKGPHTDDEKVSNVGMASHIHAAAPGGPRYSPSQTPEERKSVGNGIWTCRSCGTLIDNDETRYTADLLRTWKRDAEKRASLRLEANTSALLLECGCSATAELLSWPTCLPDGTWIERPELQRLLAMVRDDNEQPIALLGAPGSGKSALLARFSATLREEGWNVVALKADRLRATVASARDLRDYLEFPIPVASAICGFASRGLTVLVIDQLDALSDLLDVKTERLSVLLELIESVVGGNNVRVVYSARLFDYRHDTRFERLSSRELNLDLPAIDAVNRALMKAGRNPDDTPIELRQLLRTPQWLKTFLELRLSGDEDLPTTWHALAEQVWQRKVVYREGASERERVLRLLAREMARREELWIPRAALQVDAEALEQLLSQGVLLLDEKGHRIGFSHQLLYEFARARTFLGDESLVVYVLNSQASLFVRPTLWTALGYLRSVDPSRYRSELAGLWSSNLRRHVQLLLVEFMGQQADPDDHEASLLLPLLQDVSWQRATFSAIAGSQRWFERLRAGYLKAPMTGQAPDIVLPLLCAAVRVAPEETLSLVAENWGEKPCFAQFTLQVLWHHDTWNEKAFTLANKALAAVGGRHELDRLVWQKKDSQPKEAIRLITCALDRELTRILHEVSPSEPLSSGASDEERIKWQLHREPKHSLEKLLSSVSSGRSDFRKLADSAPGAFLENVLPWLAKLLSRVAEPRQGCGCYIDDYLRGSKPVDGLPNDLVDALRLAAQRLSEEDSNHFLRLVEDWNSSDLMSVHIVLSFGFEALAPTNPAAVVAYLSADQRRLSLGNFGDIQRTVSLFLKLEPVLTPSQTTDLEHAIINSVPAELGTDRSVESRRMALHTHRYHRLMLLRKLPQSFLSIEARKLVDRESQALGDDLPPTKVFQSARTIGSSMNAEQMVQAKERDILNLFNELVDATEWKHPRRLGEGGSIQAAREFGLLAKTNPDRAIAISHEFLAGKQERPVGEMLKYLAETDIETSEIENLVAGFNERGFSSEEFRTDAAWAFEKRASSLSDATIKMLSIWLERSGREGDGEPLETRGTPPFLWGLGGGGMLPQGGFPILSTVTLALLSRTPPDAEVWIKTLENHLGRGEDVNVWLAFTSFLNNGLRQIEPVRATAFLKDLFYRYPQVLASYQGVQLLAYASSWLPEIQLQELVLRLRDGTWLYGTRAFGELIGFLGVREPTMTWARGELAWLCAGKGDEPARVGAAGMCMELWDGSWRDRCTNALVALAQSGGRPEREEIVNGFYRSSVIVDQGSQRVLAALATDPEAFLSTRSSPALEWVASLVHAYPADVQIFVNGILDTLEAQTSGANHGYHQLGALVDLSVTMQRIPQHRETGLDIFERFLHMGFYGARKVLNDADVWPRFRRTV